MVKGKHPNKGIANSLNSQYQKEKYLKLNFKVKKKKTKVKVKVKVKGKLKVCRSYYTFSNLDQLINNMCSKPRLR